MNGRWALLPVAGAGFFLAHEATYRLAAHDHDHRHELLASTGHNWLPLAGPALMLMAVLAVAGGWFLTAQQQRQPKLWQILTIQTGAFLAVEVLERLLSGHNPIPQASILIAGAVAQLPVAFLVWLAFVGILMPALRVLQAPIAPVLYISGPSARCASGARTLSSQAYLGSPPQRGPPPSDM